MPQPATTRIKNIAKRAVSSTRNRSFLTLFAFKWLSGDKPAALKDPNTVLLTRSMAEKYFGSWQSAVGRSLKLDNSWVLKVTGVLADPPANTDFPLKVVISYATLRNTGINGHLNDWTGIFAQHYCFITLPGNLSEAAFDGDLTAMVNKYKPAVYRSEGIDAVAPDRHAFRHPL